MHGQTMDTTRPVLICLASHLFDTNILPYSKSIHHLVVEVVPIHLSIIYATYLRVRFKGKLEPIPANFGGK